MRKAACMTAILMVSLGAYAASEGAFKYQSKGRRDPFLPLVGPNMTSHAKLQDISSANELIFEGVATGGGGKKVAIINGEVLKKGDRVGNIEIKKITDKTVVLSVCGTDYTLTLEEGGSGK
jgi:hypothetical protein